MLLQLQHSCVRKGFRALSSHAVDHDGVSVRTVQMATDMGRETNLQTDQSTLGREQRKFGAHVMQQNYIVHSIC